MPSGPFAHISFIVRDLEASVANWTTILGALDPAQLEEPVVLYDEFEGGEDQMRWATFVSNHGAEIQLMEPAPGSPMAARLEKHGEGVHHICFTTDDPAAVSRRLASEGLSVAPGVYSDPDMAWQNWTWILPSSANGTLVEVARPYRAVAGRWESAT
jgi:methylmalonyl-CoA/ethylmalonyl-CoA epimerase